jgi:ABC-type branched-subunit amino acid transport system substrate-binding protein
MRQDQGQRRAGRAHRQLGQRPDAAGAALREVGSDARLYTFYGNALGAPAAIGEAGVGRVLAVAEWHPNVGGKASDAFYAAFRRRFRTRATTTCTCACR